MELQWLRWIQSFSSPALDVFFEAITILGESWAVIFILAAVYWLYDKRVGEQFAFTLILSGFCNNVLKGIFRLPRPIGEEGIRTLRESTATGHSFPSGHSQNGAALYFSLARIFGGGWRYAFAAVLSILIGLSRLYLGVHYPKDVVVGVLLGAGFVFLSPVLLKRFDLIKLTGVLVAAGLPLTLLLGQRDLYKAFGLLAGFWLGIWFERRWGGFSNRQTMPRKALRFLAGILLAAAIYLGGKALLPDTMWAAALRYGLLAFVSFGPYPYLFHKAGF